jgi:hypothetical protein
MTTKAIRADEFYFPWCGPPGGAETVTAYVVESSSETTLIVTRKLFETRSEAVAHCKRTLAAGEWIRATFRLAYRK